MSESADITEAEFVGQVGYLGVYLAKRLETCFYPVYVERGSTP